MLKRRIKEGEITLGTWVSIPSSTVVEIMAQAGFDWVVIDMEHTTLSIAQAGELIRVIDLAGSVPMVRLSSNDPIQVKRVLDAGAKGIIVPMVVTMEDAQNAVASMYYPPEGNRGVGLGRAQKYGPGFEEYFHRLKEELILIVQIEHHCALQNLDKIFRIPEVDGYIVGPYDLSCSMGIPGDFEHPDYAAAIDRIKKEGDQAGVAGGVHVVEPDTGLVKKYVAEGYRLMVYSVDFRIIEKQCSQAVNAIKNGID